MSNKVALPKTPRLKAYSKKGLKELAERLGLDTVGYRTEIESRVRRFIEDNEWLLDELSIEYEEESAPNTVSRTRTTRSRSKTRGGSPSRSTYGGSPKALARSATPPPKLGTGEQAPDTPLSQMRQLRDRVANKISEASAVVSEHIESSLDLSPTPKQLSEVLGSAKRSASQFRDSLTAAAADVAETIQPMLMDKPLTEDTPQTIGERVRNRSRSASLSRETEPEAGTGAKEGDLLSTTQSLISGNNWSSPMDQAAQRVLSATTERLRHLTETPVSTYCAMARDFSLKNHIRQVQRRFSTPRGLLALCLGIELFVLLVQCTPLRAVSLGPWKFYTTGQVMDERIVWVPDWTVLTHFSPLWAMFLSWLLLLTAVPYVLSVLLRPAAESAEASFSVPATPSASHRRGGDLYNLRSSRNTTTSPLVSNHWGADQPSVFSVHPLSFALARFALIFLFGGDPQTSILSNPHLAQPPMDAAIPTTTPVPGSQWGGGGLTVAQAQAAHPLYLLPLSGCCTTHTGSWSASAVCVVSTCIQNLYGIVPKNLLLLTAIATVTFTFYDILERRGR